MNGQELIVYVDVDDTLVRSIGTKRIPIPDSIAHVKLLHESGAIMYCWSSGGAEYARASATEMGIGHCFQGFLPKPKLIIDDQEISDWRYCKTVHPSSCSGVTLKDYLADLYGTKDR